MPTGTIDCQSAGRFLRKLAHNCLAKLHLEHVLHGTIASTTLLAALLEDGKFRWVTQRQKTAHGAARLELMKNLSLTTYKMIWPTYNAIVWSPEDTEINTLGNPNRLWYRVRLISSAGGNGTLLFPPTQYKTDAPFYPYPSGDGTSC